MKKIIYSAIAIMIIGFANAQKDVKFGARAGFNSAYVTISGGGI